VPDPAAQQQVQARSVEAPKSADAVLSVLAAAPSPLDMDELDAALNAASTPFSTRTVRDALKRLRDQGLVFTTKGRHELTPQARAERDEVAAVSDAELAQLALDEGGDW
jgi:Fe2+ or Zn2+ uptake regulation protein